MFTTIPIFLLITLDVPKWVIKAIGKWRCSFLWRGRPELRHGHCPVSWLRVKRPLHLGGLSVHNLEIMAWALRMRWLCLEKTDPDRPLALLNIQVPNKVRAIFAILVTITVGDGSTIIFWTDR